MNIYQAKTHLSKIVQAVEEKGQSETLCRNGKPVADLVSHVIGKAALELLPELSGARFEGDPGAPLDEFDRPVP